MYACIVMPPFLVSGWTDMLNIKEKTAVMQTKGEIWEQLGLVGPVWLTLGCRKAVDIIPVLFVGRLGPEYLAAAGLATVTNNVFGISFLIGLSGGLATILTQAYGAQAYDLMNISVQRGVLILLIACVPITLIVQQSEQIFLSLGLEDSIASNTSSYLIFLIPGLWCNAISLCIIEYLYAMKRTKDVSIVSVVMALLCPLLNYGYVYKMNLGFIGSALTVSTSRLIELIGLIFILCISSVLRLYNFSFDKRAWSNWGPLLALGIPNLVMMTEWWASEIITFLAGFIGNPDISIAAMSIYQNTNTVAYIFPKGFQISGNIRVGNELGSNRPIRAKRAGWTATGLALIISSMCGTLLYSNRNRLSFLFSDDAAVAKEVSKLLVCLSLYVIADGVQSALSGVIKGLGKQSVGGPTVLFSYYIIAIPLSLYLGFKCQWGLMGLVSGTLTGTWVHSSLYMLIIFATDWKLAANKASGRKVDENSSGTAAEDVTDSGKASFSFYSISNGVDSIACEDGFGGRKSWSSLRSIPTPHSPGQGGLWDGNIDDSTHGCRDENDDGDENMHIYKWKKIYVEETGVLSYIYKLLGMEIVKESKYELVLTENNSNCDSESDGNGVYNDQYDGDEDGNNDTAGLETVVVFRRGVVAGTVTTAIATGAERRRASSKDDKEVSVSIS